MQTRRRRRARYGRNYNRPGRNESYDYDRSGAYAGGRFGGGYYGPGEQLGGGGMYGGDYYTGRGGYAEGEFGGGRPGQEYFGTERTCRPGGHDRDLGDRMREGWRGVQRGANRAFRGGRDRDWGDRLQEGWSEAQRGVRRAMGNEPRGGYTGYGRGYDRGW